MAPLHTALRILAALVLAFAAHATMADERVIGVPDDDTEMNAAIASARASLPSFWAELEKPKPGEENFALKVRITEAGKSEHFWLVDVTREKGVLSGRINNDPQDISTVENGQRYTFSQTDISDWMFMRNGRIVGNATLRPLLGRMEPQEAETYRKLLETP